MKKTFALVSIICAGALNAGWPSLHLTRPIDGDQNQQEPAIPSLYLIGTTSNGPAPTGGGEYEANSQVTLEAPAGTQPNGSIYDSTNPHLVFLHWKDAQGTVVSSNATFTFPASADASYSAVYEKASTPAVNVWYSWNGAGEAPIKGFSHATLANYVHSQPDYLISYFPETPIPMGKLRVELHVQTEFSRVIETGTSATNARLLALFGDRDANVTGNIYTNGSKNMVYFTRVAPTWENIETGYLDSSVGETKGKYFLNGDTGQMGVVGHGNIYSSVVLSRAAMPLDRISVYVNEQNDAFMRFRVLP